jgi:hypothetical protein
MKERFWFDEFCDNEFKDFANRLRFFCEIQSHFDATCQIDLLFFFYFYFAVRSSRDVFTILTYVASFVLVDDVEIAIARAMFFPHVLHTTVVLQCLSMWSYFWQLKHCRKMQFLMNRSRFFISKAFSNSSNNNRFVIFTMTISIWRIEYFFFFSYDFLRSDHFFDDQTRV